jgi:hypothetical protein
VGAGAGAVGGKLSDIGIDDQFLKERSESLPPGTSALFVLVRKATPDKVLEDAFGSRTHGRRWPGQKQSPSGDPGCFLRQCRQNPPPARRPAYHPKQLPGRQRRENQTITAAKRGRLDGFQRLIFVSSY